VGQVNLKGAFYPASFTVEAYVNRVTPSIEELIEVTPRCPDIVNIGKGVVNRTMLIACPAADTQKQVPEFAF